jgi:DNA-binding MarR family transcriptional regulator
MPRPKADETPAIEDVDAVTDAVLTASRLLVAISARSVAAIDESLTLPQFRLLVVLHTRGPLKLASVAEWLGVNPSTVTRMIDRLLAANMVERQANPASRRETVVSLTPSGAVVVARVTDQRRAEIARIVAAMPASSRSGLVEALTAFAEAGGEPPISSSPYNASDTHWA